MPCKCTICGQQFNLTEDFKLWPKIQNVPPKIIPITENGDAKSEIYGFICDRCLQRANRMKAYISNLFDTMIVSDHAIERYKKRQEGEPGSKKDPRVTIKKLFSHAKQIRFSSGFMVSRLIQHDFQDVNYYYHSGWIFVVSQDDPKVIITVERSWHRKLGKDFEYLD